MPRTYTRNDDGQVIDPPVLPDFEARLAAAHNAADQDAINALQEDYDKARQDRIKSDEAAAKKAARDNNNNGDS